MLKNFTLKKAYILHTRPYRDTSLLIEAFTPSEGRFTLLAKGARGKQGKNARFKGLLQAFIPLLIAWRGKTDLPYLTHAEPNGFSFNRLFGKHLLCGLYLNELLIHLLYRHDSHPALFNAYHAALTHLPDNAHLALRLFEKKLLCELGYALELHQDCQTGQPILADQHYQFIPSQGLVICFKAAEYKPTIFSGESLLAIHTEHWVNLKQLQDAKRLFRLALTHLLEGKKIRSRELFVV